MDIDDLTITHSYQRKSYPTVTCVFVLHVSLYKKRYKNKDKSAERML